MASNMPHMNNTALKLGVVPHHNLVSLQYNVMWLWGYQNGMMIPHVILGCSSSIQVTRECRRVGIVMLYLQNMGPWQSESRSYLCFQTAQMLQQRYNPQDI